MEKKTKLLKSIIYLVVLVCLILLILLLVIVLNKNNYNESSNLVLGDTKLKYGAAVYYDFVDSKTLSKFDLLIINEEDSHEVEKIKKISQNSYYYMYKHIGANSKSSLNGSLDARFHTAVEDFYSFELSHPDWFLTRNNKRVVDSYFYNSNWKLYYLDISNKEVRTYIINKYVLALERHNLELKGVQKPLFDGVMIDIAPANLWYYQGETDQIKTKEEAFDSYKLFLIEAKQMLNSKGYELIVEWSRTLENPELIELIPYVDGVFIEAYYTDWDGNIRSRYEINKQNNYIIRIVKNNGKVIIQPWMNSDDNLNYDLTIIKSIYLELQNLKLNLKDYPGEIILMSPHGYYNGPSANKALEVFKIIEN